MKQWHNKVIYQIYPQSFMDSNNDGIGDLLGIKSKLGYLNQLGVDYIWLSPIYESPMDDNGYDISDYYTIAKRYGTMDDFKSLVVEARSYGIGIIMDLVVNHTSDEHPWFVESRSSKDNPKRDWYIWKDTGSKDVVPNNWGSYFSDNGWEYDETREAFYLHIFSKKQPDLNWENPEVREAVYDVMRYWLDLGIAGFRMDVINLISKPQSFEDSQVASQVSGSELWANGPKVHTYLKEMHEKVISKYNMVTVGETLFATVEDGQKYTGNHRHELDMIFQFEHMAVDANPNDTYDMKDLDLVALKQVMTKWQEGLIGKGWNSLYWNNHDQPRIVSRFGDDQEHRVTSAKMLATTLHFMFGTPFIYQGEEIGMTNIKFDHIDEYQDIWAKHYYKLCKEEGLDEATIMNRLYRRSRDNTRTPMQWTDKGGFTEGKPWIQMNPNTDHINVTTAIEDKDSVFHHYKQLIQLRKSDAYGNVMVYGNHQLLMEDNPYIYAYLRTMDGQKLLVLSNFTGDSQQILLDFQVKEVVITNYTDRDYVSVPSVLSPYESVVLAVE